MPKFAANLTMMYGEYPFLDRFYAAKKDGFGGVEFLFPYDFVAAEIKSRLDENDLIPVLFNCPPGDWAAGERGIASLPGRQDEFKRSIEIGKDKLATACTTKRRGNASPVANAFCQSLCFGREKESSIDLPEVFFHQSIYKLNHRPKPSLGTNGSL